MDGAINLNSFVKVKRGEDTRPLLFLSDSANVSIEIVTINQGGTAEDIWSLSLMQEEGM